MLGVYAGGDRRALPGWEQREWYWQVLVLVCALHAPQQGYLGTSPVHVLFTLLPWDLIDFFFSFFPLCLLLQTCQQSCLLT